MIKQYRTKELKIKVEFPDSLYKYEILNALKNGLHYIIGSGDPESDYIKELGKVKISEIRRYNK